MEISKNYNCNYHNPHYLIPVILKDKIMDICKIFIKKNWGEGEGVCEKCRYLPSVAKTQCKKKGQ